MTKPVTTIYADGSFCPNTGAAGYGVWLKSDRGQLEYGGALFAAVTQAEEAEWCAVANGVVIASVRELLIPGGIVAIASDCMAVIHGLLGMPFVPVRGDLVRKAFTTIKEYARMHNCKVSAKHVKGHSNKDAARSFCNARCDALAGEAMRKRREDIRRLRDAGLSVEYTVGEGTTDARRRLMTTAQYPWEEGVTNG